MSGYGTGVWVCLFRSKISADAWVVAASGGGMAVEASIVGGRFVRVAIEGPAFDGAAGSMEQSLIGADARAEVLRAVLGRFGEDGERLLELLRSGLPPA